MQSPHLFLRPFLLPHPYASTIPHLSSDAARALNANFAVSMDCQKATLASLLSRSVLQQVSFSAQKPSSLENICFCSREDIQYCAAFCRNVTAVRFSAGAGNNLRVVVLNRAMLEAFLMPTNVKQYAFNEASNEWGLKTLAQTWTLLDDCIVRHMGGNWCLHDGIAAVRKCAQLLY